MARFNVRCEWTLGERRGVDLNHRFGCEVEAESADAAERIINARLVAAATEEGWTERELESATAIAELCDA